MFCPPAGLLGGQIGNSHPKTCWSQIKRRQIPAPLLPRPLPAGVLDAEELRAVLLSWTVTPATPVAAPAVEAVVLKPHRGMILSIL